MNIIIDDQVNYKMLGWFEICVGKIRDVYEAIDKGRPQNFTVSAQPVSTNFGLLQKRPHLENLDIRCRLIQTNPAPPLVRTFFMEYG